MINHLSLSYFLLPLQCERKYETKGKSDDSI